MIKAAEHLQPSGAAPRSLSRRPFLAADIGGTHARLGLVRDAGRGLPVEILAYHRYTCGQWPSLEAMLQNFVAQLSPDAPITRFALASAGYPLGDVIVNDNLPWPVSVDALRSSLGIEQLEVINDFEAVAWATQFLADADARSVIDTDAPPARGPVLVMGPGTGLGCAVLMPGKTHPRVLATEAGQITLAPGNEREIEILRLLRCDRTHVAFEHALSGPGLLNLYRAICSLLGETPTLAQPTEVSASAMDNSNPAAVEALAVFCGLLGSFAGDLAMLYGASGGIYLAGGILPQIHDVLMASAFRERFFNKGVMRPFLQQVPVRLMEHGQHGVMGAAGLFLQGQAPDAAAG